MDKTRIENLLKKTIEQAYRKGVFDCKDCNKSNDAINALLITSQVVAHGIYRNSEIPKVLDLTSK